jgi:hypothetical protein
MLSWDQCYSLCFTCKPLGFEGFFVCQMMMEHAWMEKLLSIQLRLLA